MSKNTNHLTGPIPKSIFSTRTYNLLMRNGIFTWEELLSRTETEIFLLRYSGPATVDKIKDILTKEGLSLKTE